MLPLFTASEMDFPKKKSTVFACNIYSTCHNIDLRLQLGFTMSGKQCDAQEEIVECDGLIEAYLDKYSEKEIQ